MNHQTQPSRKIFLASDHAGFSLKNILKVYLKEKYPHFECIDLGCDNEQSVDYPDFAKAVAQRVSQGAGVGILICGTGIGQSIVANKFKNVRAAVAWNTTAARLSREHNDANVLCLGARLLGGDVALDIVKEWLATPFEGGRHLKRIEKIKSLEAG